MVPLASPSPYPFLPSVLLSLLYFLRVFFFRFSHFLPFLHSPDSAQGKPTKEMSDYSALFFHHVRNNDKDSVRSIFSSIANAILPPSSSHRLLPLI